MFSIWISNFWRISAILGVLTENLPADVRATGTGFLYNIGVLGGAVAPYIVLSTISAADITMRTGMVLFIGIGLLLGLILLSFARDIRGISINEVDTDAGDADENQGHSSVNSAIA